jgi:hypothetical protein
MITKCIFCGRKREGKEASDTDWVSEIWIVSEPENTIFEKMTVCPSCRLQHKIGELYGATLEKDKNGERKEYSVKDLIKNNMR